MKNVLRCAMLISVVAPCLARAQEKTAQQIVESVVQTEIAADRDDRTMWIYKDHDVTPEHDALYLVAESPVGQVKRKLEDHGQPVTAEQTAREMAHIQAFAADLDKQQKARKDAKHDDDQAEAWLRLFPVAFLWTVESSAGDSVTLSFGPNPAFRPQSNEAKVLAAMGGKLVIARSQNRIRLLEGQLMSDVSVAMGLAHMRKGGSFRVEHREVAPGHWQIVDYHVHIEGRAMLLKTVGSQEDETKTDFRPSSAKTVPEAAAEVAIK